MSATILVQKYSGVKSVSVTSESDNVPASLTFQWRKNVIVINRDEFNIIYDVLKERAKLILDANPKKKIEIVVLFSTPTLVFSTINSRNGLRRGLGLYMRNIPINLIPFSRPELQILCDRWTEIHNVMNLRPQPSIHPPPPHVTTSNIENRKRDHTQMMNSSPQPSTILQNDEEASSNTELDHSQTATESPASPTNVKDRGLPSADKFHLLCRDVLNSPSYQRIYEEMQHIPTKKMRYLMSPLYVNV